MNFSNLLHWAIIFLVVALVAALLGFGGVAGTAMQGAKLLFWVAIILAIVAFVVSLVRKPYHLGSELSFPEVRPNSSFALIRWKSLIGREPFERLPNVEVPETGIDNAKAKCGLAGPVVSPYLRLSDQQFFLRLQVAAH